MAARRDQNSRSPGSSLRAFLFRPEDICTPQARTGTEMWNILKKLVDLRALHFQKHESYPNFTFLGIIFPSS